MSAIDNPYDWAGVPSTDGGAVVLLRETVKEVLAISTTMSSLRDAVVKNETFEIAEVDNPIRLIKGKLCVEVKCSWYGKRAVSTDTQRITINNKYKLIRNYSGQVVKNIGR
jgi:hypothetical protein